MAFRALETRRLSKMHARTGQSPLAGRTNLVDLLSYYIVLWFWHSRSTKSGEVLCYVT